MIGRSQYRLDVAASGVMTYTAVPPGAGKVHSLISPGGERTLLRHRPSGHADASLSPSGDRIAYFDGEELLVFDIELGSHTVLARGLANTHNATWSPRGDQVAFTAAVDSIRGVFLVAADGSDGAGPGTRVAVLPGSQLSDWIESSEALLAVRWPGPDVVRVDLSGEIEPVLDADWREQAPTVSPDGRWLAYVSWVDGAPRAYAVRWPALTSKVLLSAPDAPLAAALTTSTGVLFWSADSRTIYYPDGSGIVALEVDGSGETLVLGERRQHLPLRNGDMLKGLHPDGRRFLVEHLPEIDAGGESGVVTVVTGFHEMLRRRGVMGEPR